MTGRTDEKRATAVTGGRAGQAFRRWVPLAQAASIGAAVLVILALLLSPSTSGWLGLVVWLLGAVAVPALWAYFIYTDKRSDIPGQLRKAVKERERGEHLNQLLLYAGLIVGIAGGWYFATEVAKAGAFH